MSTTAKRPVTEPNDTQPAKRRSTRACLSCRNRKVRCDVVLSGIPYNNCRLDDIECQLRESKRGRKPREASVDRAPLDGAAAQTARTTVTATTNATSTTGALATTAATTTPRTTVVAAGHSSGDATASPANTSSSLHHGATRHINSASSIDHRLPVSLTFEDALGDGMASEIADGANGLVHSSPDSDVTCASRGMMPLQVLPQPLDLETLHVPSYLKPLRASLSREDIDFLARKDALTIPPHELRDALLRAYVQIVYPYMPAIDLVQLIGPIVGHAGCRPLSILLFQAVMFAGSTFVSLDLLEKHGYTTRQTARKSFFQRVRLLHGLDCEEDQTVTLQAVLLMTYWYDGPKDDKDTWYWFNIALTHAHVLGLHRDPDDLQVSQHTKRLRKRIWWSCVMRDKLLALGIRRPTRIRPEETTVPVLAVDDFEFDALPETVLHFLGKASWIGDSTTQNVLATCCVELAKLCVIMDRILRSQYSMIGTQSGTLSTFTSLMMFPRQSAEQAKRLAECDEDLEIWQRNLSSKCHYAPSSLSSEQRMNELTSLVYLQRALLRMVYLTAVGALHRPQVLQHESDSAQTMSKQTPKGKVTEAAIGVTELIYDLQSSSLLAYVSTTGVPALVSAIMIHLSDTRSPISDIRNMGIGRFYQCMQALEQIGEMYTSADHALAFLATVIRSTSIKIPMLFYSSGPSHNSKRGFREPNTTTPIPATIPTPSSTGVNTSAVNAYQMNRYPTPSSYGQQQMSHVVTTPPTTYEAAGHGQTVNMDIFNSAMPENAIQGDDQFKFSGMDVLEGGNWDAPDSLLSAIMVPFDPTETLLPRATGEEQAPPWLASYI